MKIAIACDHAGYELKEYIKNSIAQEFDVIDLGTDSGESVDYPDFAKKLCLEIDEKSAKFGILICGSGIGISIAANRDPNIRAALCYNEEITKLARQHNDANVIVLGARFIGEQDALNLCKVFFSTEFEGGRHKQRVDKLSC